jgi:hypothetical protein
MALERDAVPPYVTAAARASFQWAGIDRELAHLVYDSYLDGDDARAGVRGPGSARQLTFESPSLTVELEVTATPARRLVGQLVPPRPGTVEVCHRDGSFSVEADDLGRFAAERVPPGPLSLRCAEHSARPVATDWVLI